MPVFANFFMNIKEFLEKHDNLVLIDSELDKEATLFQLIKLGYNCPLQYGMVGKKFDCTEFLKNEDNTDSKYQCINCKNFIQNGDESCTEVDYNDWKVLRSKYRDICGYVYD